MGGHPPEGRYHPGELNFVVELSFGDRTNIKWDQTQMKRATESRDAQGF